MNQISDVLLENKSSSKNSSSNSDPVHTYSQGGSYEVSLTVTNIYGMESDDPHIETLVLQSSMAGDVNNDSMLNVLDIVLIVNFVLGSETPNSSEFISADLNSDRILNTFMGMKTGKRRYIVD